MLFEPEHYGLPISELLAKYLRENTNTNDMATASERTGVGMSTIKYVLYRTNSLTEGNSPAIIEMIKIAIENCKSNIEKSIKAKNFFEKIFDKITV